MLLLGTPRSDPLFARSPTRHTTNLAVSGLARKKTVNVSRLGSLDTMRAFEKGHLTEHRGRKRGMQLAVA
jgi:hypothetical protein